MRISDWSSDVCSSDLLGVDLEASRWLTLRHGSDISAIAALIAAHPSLARRVHADAPFVHAEAVHAVRAEMALSVDDLARRRMRSDRRRVGQECVHTGESWLWRRHEKQTKQHNQ